MKIILTQKIDIKTKTGVEFVKMSALTEKGEAVEIFTTKEKFEMFNVPQDRIVSLTVIKSMFDSLPVSEIEYNKMGRVENLK